MLGFLAVYPEARLPLFDSEYIRGVEGNLPDDPTSKEPHDRAGEPKVDEFWLTLMGVLRHPDHLDQAVRDTIVDGHMTEAPTAVAVRRESHPLSSSFDHLQYHLGLPDDDPTDVLGGSKAYCG